MSLIDDFKLALDDLGVKWFEAGQSLKIQDCPACGSQKFKVHLRIEEEKEVLFGRCYSGQCQENYSSFKYLLMSGVDYGEVARIHGKDPLAHLGGLSPDVDELLGLVAKEPAKPKTVDITEDTELFDIKGFFKLGDWADHPANLYALSRGALPEHEAVMIDPETNAVVFVVREGRKLAGFQRRFVTPIHKDLKTKSSLGFQKSQHLLHFPRDNAPILVCEGPFTAIAAWHYGYYGICTFGSAVSEIQVKKIAELAEKLKQRVGIAFDLDEAGQKGFGRLRSGLFWKDQEIFRVVVDANDLPQGFDLNDAWKKGMKVKEITNPWSGPAIPDIPSFAP